MKRRLSIITAEAQAPLHAWPESNATSSYMIREAYMTSDDEAATRRLAEHLKKRKLSVIQPQLMMATPSSFSHLRYFAQSPPSSVVTENKSSIIIS
jgi:hypothetical protein